MVLVMGDCHESIGYRSPAAMGQCHECCGGARGGRLSVKDQGPVGGLRMVAQRPLREPAWQTSVQTLPSLDLSRYVVTMTKVADSTI